MGIKPLPNINGQNKLRFMDSASDQRSSHAPISRGVLGAVHSVGRIPTYLMNAWKSSTTTQKIIGISSVIYCTAATAYIIYLETQKMHNLDCPVEISDDLVFVEKLVEKGTQPILRNYNVHLSANLEQCEKEFYESGADKSNPNGVIGMQVCYPLINRMCEARESILRFMSELEKKPGKFQRDLASISNRVIEDLEYMRQNFFCKRDS